MHSSSNQALPPAGDDDGHQRLSYGESIDMVIETKGKKTSQNTNKASYSFSGISFEGYQGFSRKVTPQSGDQQPETKEGDSSFMVETDSMDVDSHFHEDIQHFNGNLYSNSFFDSRLNDAFISSPPPLMTPSSSSFPNSPYQNQFQYSIKKTSILTEDKSIANANPLYIPEILTHILSFLESPITTSTDPTQPLDFVKVDSIKYSVSKPKLHSCALVNKMWNKCATNLLWKSIKIGHRNGVDRLARTLGSKTKGGQIGRLSAHEMQANSVKNVCWGINPQSCKFHEGFLVIPSPVNSWKFGELMRSFSVVQPHGPGSEAFQKWDLDFLVSLIAISCPYLEDLNLSNCSQITDKSLTLIARHCKHLKKLNLNRCDLISSSAIEELASGCKKLKIINLSRPLLNPKRQISDESLSALVVANPEIMELRLRNCEKVSDDTIIAMAKTCGKNLRALDLSWCGNITDRALLEGISPHCPNLTSLALNGCKRLTDISIISLLGSCPTIMSLSLAHLPFITDRILTSMAEKLSKLVILSLNGCVEVRDDSIISLAQHCPNLQSLSLFSLAITDNAVAKVSEGCKNLTSLSISGCRLVTDEGATKIAQLVKLQSLYLNGAVITDQSILKIAANCSQIRALSLNECKKLTDKAVVALSRSCSNIQSLSMNCCGVSIVGVKSLVDRCVDLRELSVKDCQNCVFDGPGSDEIVYGNGGMDHLSATASQVANKIRRRRIALMR